ncbi:hypothetical protein [Occallatibacter riparius]|uniref:Uncharacterized protein n=1 Tax=Occallatibacter riparius TaxID=1002689 RepID=A0A9J7BL70_9BACT|nr:hypothetical protein [Occallatibacter riparius]UWZ81989.1 hypothetical protein MOP44_15560 [Occallatibacter riparius]
MAHITVFSNGKKSTYADARLLSIEHGILKFKWSFSDASGNNVVQTITTTCPFLIEDPYDPTVGS